jgi:hypothetical protein
MRGEAMISIIIDAVVSAADAVARAYSERAARKRQQRLTLDPRLDKLSIDEAVKRAREAREARSDGQKPPKDGG